MVNRGISRPSLSIFVLLAIGALFLGSAGSAAKIGISTSGTERHTIFGDMNQQGIVAGDNSAPTHPPAN